MKSEVCLLDLQYILSRNFSYDLQNKIGDILLHNRRRRNIISMSIHWWGAYRYVMEFLIRYIFIVILLFLNNILYDKYINFFLPVYFFADGVTSPFFFLFY